MEMACHDTAVNSYNRTRNNIGVFLIRRTACLSDITYADIFIYIQQLLDDITK